MRAETRIRLDEFQDRPMDAEKIKDMDAFFDALPYDERVEAVQYGVANADAEMKAKLGGYVVMRVP